MISADKYDVPPKIRKKRSQGFRTPRASKRSSKTFESTMSASSDSPSSPAGELLSPGKDSDALSIVSSQGSDMSDYDKIDRSELINAGLPALPDSTVEAVRRAQVRFMTLVRASSSSSGNKRLSIGSPAARKVDGQPAVAATSAPTRPILKPTLSEAAVFKAGVESGLETEDDDGPETKEPQEPVFDSSAKQRVQSYTGQSSVLDISKLSPSS